jgi:hypothetical protein
MKRRPGCCVKWPRISCKSAQLKVRQWRQDFVWYLECVIRWGSYSSCVKICCKETASGECNRLRMLVCVCRWSVKCSHESWVYKRSINRVTNPHPVYSHSILRHSGVRSGRIGKCIGSWWLYGHSTKMEQMMERLRAAIGGLEAVIHNRAKQTLTKQKRAPI